MIRTLIPALGFMLLLTGTSHGAPFCDSGSDGSQFSFSMSSDPNEDNDDRDSFDMMHLRQRGVDVTGVERWNGCIRAFVRKPEGGQEMQFFKPGSYIRVY